MKTLEGKLLQFNHSPKGDYDGLLMETQKGIVQFNFAPDQASNLISWIPPDAQLSIKGLPWDDDRPKDHPVFELAEIKVDGKPLRLDSITTVKGVVSRLNYAKHGEVNGAVLDTGTFVHLKPHGAAMISLQLGQTIDVEGEAKTNQLGACMVVEAHTVNGVSLEQNKAGRKAAHKTAKKATKRARK